MMTNVSAKPAARGRGYDRTVIEGAGSNEAVRTGHPDVGFEHLFLGLLVNGGPAARLLMDAGVGLVEARAAIAGLQGEDLALLGVDVPSAAAEGRPEVITAGLLPLAPRLRELVDECPGAGGDQALLAALIDDEGGRIRRLLDRLGVDTDRIRGALDGPISDREGSISPWGEGDLAAGSRGKGWKYDVYESEVPVSAERLWALVGSVERRGEWDRGAVSSRLLDDGSVELTRDDGRREREWITHSVPGRAVTWSHAFEGNEDPHRVFEIVIEPVGGHARLYLRKGVHSAWRGRIADRFVRWIVRNDLRIQAQLIAQVAAD